MIRVLYIGDPHATPGNLTELDSLLSFIVQLIQERSIDRIVLLGDQFHTHANVRLEVLEFWSKWLKKLSDTVETVALVGNHDMTGLKGSTSNAMSVFKDKAELNKSLHIVETFKALGPFLYAAYIHDSNEFIYKANQILEENDSRVLVSHQTYAGSQFENGFYAPDGVDPDKLNVGAIISGHIHRRQRFGKVIYPGTARWLTASDANEDKGLWLVEHDDILGHIIEEEFISTAHVCQPVRSVTWREGEEMPEIAPNSRTTVEMIGTSEWIKRSKTKLKGKVSIKTKITDHLKSANRKPGTSLADFINNTFDISTGLSKEDLVQYMKELGF